MRAYPASADTTRFLCVQEGAVRVAGRMSGYLCPPECPRSDDKSVQEGAVSGSFGRAPLTCPAKRPRTCFLLLPTCEALACVPTTKVLVFVRKKMPRGRQLADCQPSPPRRAAVQKDGCCRL